ncbi:alpha/beta fold hydrolase [Haloferula sp. BvORR071]|uniref:esterase/lipase family protein n=1 Tax=Haloferula sp. BvORR071 TaxID=1396141 RepID=UPI000AE40B16|nr:alpha/beta fold hydrolase [Haloferula sp. BvORR071]
MKMRATLGVVMVLVLTQCGTPSAPQCHSLPRASRGDTSVMLAEARSSWQLVSRTGDPAAVAAYNAAVAKLFDHLHCGSGSIQDKAAAMGTTIDETHSLGAGIHLKDLDAIMPAASIDTKAIGARHVSGGIGVPVVGWKKTAEEGKPRWEFEPPTGVPLNLTALLRFPEGKPPQWSFAYPGRVKTAEVGHRKVSVAADWSAASALYWKMSDLDDLDLAKVFLPSRFSDETALYVSSPYDPKRIPVVMVHGLNSSPGAFKRLYNELNREPWFRENYQVWFYSYPTGNNWLYSAANFRLAMASADKYARKQGPTDKWEKMVVIGHSMGGVISHASLMKPGDAMYQAFQQRPLDQVTSNKNLREAVRLLTMYEPLEPPDRVIFMAAPHQGSPMADRFFTAWMRNLIRLPKTLTVNLIDFTLHDLGSVISSGESSSKGWLTSMGSLSPGYPAYKAMREAPMRSGLKVHSVIGDRGRGDTPNSSDGIVPYWSSHLDGVESERIVPSGHSVQNCPEAEVEVKRILKRHLDGQPRATP